jgi:hypothetical protein
MEELSLTTPALLFSAVSLILLAYTNRFLSYAQLVRTLKEQHLQHPSKVTRAQIDNLRRRLHLTRTMQLLGVTSLFLCVVTMFLIYVGLMLLLERAHQMRIGQKPVGVGQQNQRHGRKQQGGGRKREFFHRYRDLRCKDTLFIKAKGERL